MGLGRDCLSRGYLTQWLKSHSSESRDCPNDFCPSPNFPRDLCPITGPLDDFGTAKFVELLGTRVLWDSPGISEFFRQPTFGTQNPWGHKSQESPIVPMELQNPMGLESQIVPKLGIWLSYRLLSRDCPSDICPSPKRLKRISPDPSPRSRHPSHITNPWVEYQGIFCVQ